MTRIYADRLTVGTEYQLGEHVVTEAEIVEFATAWDPQYFHVSAELAAQGHFGGLIASGLHTLAVFQRLAVDRVLGSWAVIAGRRLTDIQFPAPVRPDMRLTGLLTITAIDRRGSGRDLVTAACILLAGEIEVMAAQMQVYVATSS